MNEAQSTPYKTRLFLFYGLCMFFAGVTCAGFLSSIVSSISLSSIHLPSVNFAAKKPDAAVSSPVLAPSAIPPVADAAPAPAEAVSATAVSVPASSENEGLRARRELHIVAKRGDNFTGMLERAGVGHTQAFSAGEALEGVYDVHGIGVGQQVTLVVEHVAGEDAPELMSFRIAGGNKEVEVSRNDNGDFVAHLIPQKLVKRTIRAGGIVNGSILQTAGTMRIPRNVMREIIEAYGYDVDFQRDIHSGDRFEVMYETYENERGKTVRLGEVLFARLKVAGGERRLYHFTTAEGESNYYTEDGRSVRKALLRTPINGAHVTSGFGMRLHPILGYSKMHRGIDFAAPIGTPILAAGDGRIEEMHFKGAYGNYVRIRHNTQYATAYAHISRYAPGMHQGKIVRQGQVIAFVGATGMATGAHLHYETIINGVQVNPTAVKMAQGDVLSRKDFVRFKHHRENVRLLMANLPMQTQIAFR